MSRTTIYRKRDKWINEGRLIPKSRSGCPRYFNNRSLRQLKLYILRDGRAFYNDIRKDLGINASDNIIRAALKLIYVNHWRAAKRIPLLEEDEKLRYHWAKLWSRDLERLLRVGVLKLTLVLIFYATSTHNITPSRQSSLTSAVFKIILLNL